MYPPFVQEMIFPDVTPASPLKSIVDQVHDVYGWTNEDVDTIIFRHVCNPMAEIELKSDI